MLDGFECPPVCPLSPIHYPRIVVNCLILRLWGRLNKQKSIIDENLTYIWTHHERILVNDFRFIDVRPIDFIYWVLVDKGNLKPIIEVIGIYIEAGITFAFVEAFHKKVFLLINLDSI